MGNLIGYRTIIINVLTIAAAALGAFPADWSPDTVAGVLAAVNVALRLLTSGPVGFIK